MAVWEWVLKRQEYCISCRQAKLDTDCQTCEYKQPQIMEENRQAWRLWNAVKTQWRTGVGGIVGLDYTALKMVAKMLDIKMNPCMLIKISELERITMEEFSRRMEVNKNGGK